MKLRRPTAVKLAPEHAGRVRDLLSRQLRASAALIGLLFVAVSIAPEKVFGSDAEAVRPAQALSAFHGARQRVLHLHGEPDPRHQDRDRGHHRRLRLGNADARAVDSRQALAGPGDGVSGRRPVSLERARLRVGAGRRHPALGVRPATGSLSGLLELILGAYAIGLGRAWELRAAKRLHLDGG